MPMSRSDSPQWLPEFCSLPTLFAVMVVAELVALVVCLGPNPGAEPLLPRLGVLTVYVQWLALVNAALLCSLRKPLEKLPVPAGRPGRAAGTPACFDGPTRPDRRCLSRRPGVALPRSCR